MAENEKALYKKQWKKKYLKQLCGFANSNGGSIYIEDNAAKEQDLTAAAFAEVISKKIEDALGIPALICETQIQGVRCFEICVAPSMRPVAYDGEYYGDGPKGVRKLEGDQLVEMISAKFDTLLAGRKKDVMGQKKKKTEKKKSKKAKLLHENVQDAMHSVVQDTTYSIEETLQPEYSEAACEAAAIEQPKLSRADLMEEKLIALFREDPFMKQETAAEKLGISLRTVKRIVRALTDSGKLIRAGGRRYGHWEINEEA